jgi:hypothetical protein
MEQLQTVMQSHGVDLLPYAGWLVTDHGFPALRGNWLHQIGNQDIGRLDVQVLLDDDQILGESFSGLGDGVARY